MARWNGIQDARNLGRRCPVLADLLSMTESDRRTIDLEDCLNMAIYTPNLSGSLPVMVYVHGGTFSVGSAVQYPPNYILSRNVILVVVQYRLDALGFLCTNSNDIPGNAGLMDLVLALKFVKENIVHFGGNPNSVTLFGQSAGAALISALNISPVVSKNLFNRVIIQSGSVFSRWSVTTDPAKDAKDIAEAAGLNSNQFIALLNEAFMKMDVFDLLKGVDLYQKTGLSKPGCRSISIGGPTNFLPDLPQKIVSSPKYNKRIPMMIGTTKDDASYVGAVFYDFLMAYFQLNGTVNSLPAVLPLVLGSMCSFLDVAGELQNAEELATNDVTKIFPGLIDLQGTLFFKAPALQLAMSNAKFDDGNTFLYTFDYQGEKTRFGYETDTSHYPFKGGVSHSDDLIYLFPYPLQVAKLNEADTKMAQKIVNLWTSFAENGSPIRNDKGNVFSWDPMVTGTFGPYARIDKNSEMTNYYPKEFVRNVSMKQTKIYKQLVSMLSKLIS